MKLDKLKLDKFSRDALYLSEQTFDVAVKCGYYDMDKKEKAYAVHMLCKEIRNVVPVLESEMDYLYNVMYYNSLRLLLESMCNDKKRYYVEVLDECKDSRKAWKIFGRMKHVLDNVESELFCK